MSIKKSKDISIILFKLFIENNASLNNLYIYTSTRIQLFCHICDKILDNPKFISEIEIFSFDNFHYFQPVENLISIQKILSSLTSLLSNSIKHIDLSTNRIEFETDFAKIIQSQTHLSSAKLSFPKILDSLKHSSNTSTSINLIHATFIMLL